MKLRQVPDDFIVEEIPLSDRVLNEKGKFAIYKVAKVGMTTFAAEKVLAKKCDVKFNKIGFAGMKDAHARTVQYFSVETNNPQAGVFKEQNVSSELVGFSDEPIKTGNLQGNTFIITVRELKESEIEKLKRNEESVKIGVPNYFDSQRFGSLKGTSDFIAKDILKGDYEAAVKKVMTATTRHQKAKIRQTKRFIEINWGNWEACLQELQKNGLERTGDAAMVVILKENPLDFKSAFRKTFAGIRQLFFSAYQSFIWNECAKKVVRVHSAGVFSVPYEAGKLVFPKKIIKLPGSFPLIAGDLRAPQEQMKIIKEVLGQESMQLDDFFTEEHILIAREREVFIVPKDLKITIAVDERSKGKMKAVLEFTLPKGSYATIVTKALFEQ